LFTPTSNNFSIKIPGPTQGSKIFLFFSIIPNRETMYSAVLGGVITTPKSFLLNLIIIQPI